MSDPHLRFSEILRLILRHLGVAGAVDNDATAIEACRAALATHAENNRIFSIVFDEAERVPDQTIETLTRHFLGPGFDPASNLLQIVLAGRPELRKRMFVPPLSGLQTQVEIECRLRALNSREVEHYIKHRLAAAELPLDLFDPAASELITTHSRGRLDFVNAICQRALEETKTNVTAETIDAVAKDLELSGSTAPVITAAPLPNAATLLASTDISHLWSPTVIAREIAENNADNLRTSLRYGTVAMAIFCLAILGIVAWLSSEAPRTQLANSMHASETAPQPQAARSHNQVPTDRTSPTAKGQPASRSTETFAAVDRSRPTNDRSLEPPKNSAKDSVIQREPRIERTSDRELADQITKAIDNRALRGIAVSVRDGEAVLEGVVASEAQKQVAERAARDVPGLRSVVNRLTIQ